MDALLGFIPKILRALVPVQDPGETDRHFHWRVMTTFATAIVFFGSILCGLLSYGFLEKYGFDGFARSSTLRHTNETLDDLLDDAIRTAITKNKSDECKAMADHNGSTLPYAVQAKNAARARWYKIHGYEYPDEPSCQELVN